MRLQRYKTIDNTQLTIDKTLPTYSILYQWGGCCIFSKSLWLGGSRWGIFTFGTASRTYFNGSVRIGDDLRYSIGEMAVLGRIYHFHCSGVRHELFVDECEHRGFHLSSRILLYVMRQRFLIAYTMCIERLLRLPYSVYTLGYPL